MVSGHAYAKALRTVKTCVGSDWCRFGTQDSTGLGVRLEKFMWGSWTPAKVKLAVSGCPRNCAEATCKDIGVVCVDSRLRDPHRRRGRPAHQGHGAAAKVATEEEALERSARWSSSIARRRGTWSASTSGWSGSAWSAIRRRASRTRTSARALYDRFAYSQRFARIDPWAERVAGRHTTSSTRCAPHGVRAE